MGQLRKLSSWELDQRVHDQTPEWMRREMDELSEAAGHSNTMSFTYVDSIILSDMEQFQENLRKEIELEHRLESMV